MSHAQDLVSQLLGEKSGHWMADASKDVKDRGTEGVCSGKNFGGPSCRPRTRRYNLAKTFKSAKHESCGNDRVWTGPHDAVYDAALHLVEVFGNESINIDDENNEFLIVCGYDHLPAIHKSKIQEVVAKYHLTQVSDISVTEQKHGAGLDLHRMIDLGQESSVVSKQLFAEFPHSSESVEVITGLLRRAETVFDQMETLRNGMASAGIRARVQALEKEMYSIEDEAHDKIDELITQYGVTP